MSNNDLSSVQPYLLVSAVQQLVKVNLMWTSLTSEQAWELCSALPESRKLQTLGLTGNNLATVWPQLGDYSRKFPFNVICTDHFNTM